MKLFRKTIAILLCAVMLLGIMPVISFSAATTTMTLDKYYEGYADTEYYEVYEFTPKSSGYYRFFTVGYTDTYVELYDEYGNYCDWDDDSGVRFNCNLTYYLEKGYTYYYYVSGYENDYYDACITKTSDVKYTGIARGKTYEVNLDDSKCSQFFKYVPTQSGYYAFSSSGSYDAVCIFYDEYMYPIGQNDDGADQHDFYLDCYLEAGETYYFEASTYDAWDLDSYTVSIKQTPVVSSVEVVRAPYDITCYNGYIYDTVKLEGLKVKLTYTDGTVKYWEYGDDYIVGSNLDYDWYVDDYDNYIFEVYTTFDYDFFYLDVIDNPVANISVVGEPEYRYYENTNGYYDDYDGVYYYYTPDLSDLKIRVYYYDGTSEVVDYNEGVNGYEFVAYSYQYDYPWTVGYNFIEISYFDVYTYVDVIVEENPIKSLTLNTPPSDTTYVFGDENYGILFEDGEYILAPMKLDGLSFTVNYKDGTKKLIDGDDIDEYNFIIDGIEFYVDTLYAYNTGTYEATFNWAGCTLSYDVQLVDYLKGDVDLDNAVSVMDATAIQLYKASMLELSSASLAVADVDNDSSVSVMDATQIQMFKAGLVENL